MGASFVINGGENCRQARQPTLAAGGQSLEQFAILGRVKNPLLWLACCFALGIVLAPPGRSEHLLAVHATRTVPLALL